MRPGRVGMTDRFDLSFYRGKTVLITGHTGFKGSWLSEILLLAGAKVVGYSLEAPTDPSLFELLGLKDRMTSIIGDVRGFKHLKTTDITDNRGHPVMSVVLSISKKSSININPRLFYI